MPRRRIDMKKIREVLRLRYAGNASTRQIGASCHLAISTVSEYLYRAEAAGMKWPLPEEISDEDLERKLFPPRARPGETPRPLPDWPTVRKDLSRKGVTLLLLWREYKEKHPEGYGYARYAGLFCEWEKKHDLRMLQHHKSGEKLFVDYAGLTAKVTEHETGVVREVQVFVSAMGSSQKIYAKAYEGQDLKNWLLAHVEAFEFYKALPEVLVPDNLKSGVTSPIYYDPVLNPAYHELAIFYGLTVLPARVRKPRDKAKVESGVQQVERWVLAPLRDRVFFSLFELNEAILSLVDQLNSRLMKGPNASRNELFQSEDLPAMRPLPENRYAYAEWKSAKVAPDYHVEWEGHKYSVPYRFVGKRVDLRTTAHVVEIFHSSQKVCSHVRSVSRRGFTTETSHMPEAHQAVRWTPERFANWADAIGPETRGFVERILSSKEHKEHGYRTILGVLGLEKRFGRERLEAACARANELGATRYSNVKSLLDKNLETRVSPPELPSMPTHSNVRGPKHFAGNLS
jgi:transposase